MARGDERLTPDRLVHLEAPCRGCVFWELDPVARRRLGEPHDDGPAPAAKLAWLSEVLREWGSCGRVAVVEGRVVGHVVYAPAAYLPGAAGFPTAPVSADAVLLAAVHVVAEHRGHGLGRALVRAMARDLVERGGYRAVEAFATARPGGGCTAPQEFLARVGFRTHRAHPTSPRMRMDLRTTLPTRAWRAEVEAALERLVGPTRPGAVAERDTCG